MIKRGLVDFINLNRRVMADHDYPKKIEQGRPEDIAPCTAYMTCWEAMKNGREPSMPY